ncbi:flagellar protein FliT [Stutzerimonas urumqiensis]|uniref:flagellar protein FliT n=1 Tax=Stutzerimonas urumqiensis TaxID=638269 RepID=UPI003BA8A295
MNVSIRRLEETSVALREALLQQDWSSIGALDLQCRQVVEEAMRSPERDEAAIRQQLQHLLMLYRELVDRCRTEQRRIGDELRQLNQAKQGAKVYQLFG